MFDLDAGPVTITLPDAGKRFMSMQVIDEDQYYADGRLRRRHAHAARARRSARAMWPPRSASSSIPAIPRTSKQVHALQDAIKVEQKSAGQVRGAELGPGEPEQSARRAARRSARRCPTRKRMFGTKDEVDPVRHLIGAAIGLGRQSREGRVLSQRHAAAERRQDRLSAHVSRTCRSTASGRSASTTRTATSSRIAQNAYSVNNLTAKKNADGSVDVQFGGCDGKAANCLPITPGWNYIVRLYRPRAEILDGSWKFPEPQPVN